MALIKEALMKDIYDGFYRIFTKQAKNATDGDEKEDPDTIIRSISNEMAKVVADSVDKYIKLGDIIIGPDNVQVTSSAPGTPAVVSPLQPAKIK